MTKTEILQAVDSYLNTTTNDSKGHIVGSILFLVEGGDSRSLEMAQNLLFSLQ